MNLDRCKNGHMYDVSRYGENCPYCKSEGLKPEIKEKKVNLVEELDDDDRTTAYWAKDSKVDPVVGWLVCIAGSEKGKDFRIVSERNFLGRGEGMDIRIEGDMNISRKNHCSISYNPKNREFYITPGDANGLIYLSDEAVYNTRQLQSFDTLEIGESKFVFVEFCGQNFDWSKDKTKES